MSTSDDKMSVYTPTRSKTPLHQICGLSAIFELEVKPIETEVLEYCPLLTGFVTEEWVGRTEVTEVFVRWGAALTGNAGKGHFRNIDSSVLEDTELSGELRNLKERLKRLTTNAGIEDYLEELSNEIDCDENDSSEISSEITIEKLEKLEEEEESTILRNNREYRWDSRDISLEKLEDEDSDIQRNVIEHGEDSRDISLEKSEEEEEEESGIQLNAVEDRRDCRDISQENYDNTSNESVDTAMESSGTSEEEESGIDDSSDISILERSRLQKKNEKLEEEKCSVAEYPTQTYFEKRDTKEYYKTQEKFLSENNVQLRRRDSKKIKRSNTRLVSIDLLEDWKNLDLGVPLDIGTQDIEKKYAPKEKVDTYRGLAATSAAMVENEDVVILRNTFPLRPRTPYPGVPYFDDQLDREEQEKMTRGGWLYAYPDLTKDHIHTYAVKRENGTYWQMPFRHNLFCDLVNSNKCHRDSDGNLDTSGFKHDKAWFDALDAETFAPTGDVYSYFQRGSSAAPYGVPLKQDSQKSTGGRLRNALSI